MASSIEDLLNQRFTIFIFVAKDVSGDLNQVAV
ncbi:Uncharacterised protein [Vibrio cholerae]|nr:Uncharacterised protein [Vibrio cholerae]